MVSLKLIGDIAVIQIIEVPPKGTYMKKLDPKPVVLLMDTGIFKWCGPSVRKFCQWEHSSPNGCRTLVSSSLILSHCKIHTTRSSQTIE